MVGNQKDKREKLGSHMQKCIFIGYPDGYKGWSFYNPETKKIVICERAEFDERYMYSGEQRKLSPADVITYNGRLCHDMGDLWDALHNTYNAASTRTHGISCLDELEDTPVRDWVEFAGSELDDALCACSNNSAPGPDHITWKHLRALNKGHDVHHVFLALANACLRVGCWPMTFKESLSVIILKPGKPSYTIPKAYRPIVLLNTLGKLIEKMLSNRIQFDGINLDIFHPNQIGGIHQRSTEDAGIFLTHYVRAGWSRGLKTSMVAFNLAQFFPSLNHE
ncbi:hypothetical protein CVT26_014379, partial [Gymnopilus dilepis]